MKQNWSQRQREQRWLASHPPALTSPTPAKFIFGLGLLAGLIIGAFYGN